MHFSLKVEKLLSHCYLTFIIITEPTSLSQMQILIKIYIYLMHWILESMVKA